MKKIITSIISLTAIIFLSACSGGEAAPTMQATTTDTYKTLEQVIGTSAAGKRLVGKILTEPELDYEKTATAAYDVLTFTDGVCSEYCTYYFYSSLEDYTAARLSYAEMMLEEPQINSEKSLYFGVRSTDEGLEDGVSTMKYETIKRNWTKYETREIV